MLLWKFGENVIRKKYSTILITLQILKKSKKWRIIATNFNALNVSYK